MNIPKEQLCRISDPNEDDKVSDKLNSIVGLMSLVDFWDSKEMDEFRDIAKQLARKLVYND